MEKCTGRPIKDIPYVSSKDVATAKELLAKISLADRPQFFDYALAAAKKIQFDVQHLGGLRQYLDGYLERHTAMAQHARRAAADKQTMARIAYGEYRRRAALALFTTLPPSEQRAIETVAVAGRPSGKLGPMAATILELAKARLTAERHPDRILSFEHWSKNAPSNV